MTSGRIVDCCILDGGKVPWLCTPEGFVMDLVVHSMTMATWRARQSSIRSASDVSRYVR